MDQPPEITSAKFKEVIKKLKENKDLGRDIQKIIETNQQIRRNATNIAKEIPRTCGQEVPLNERKKMQQQQNLAKQLAKQSCRIVKGDVGCIMMLQGGNICSHTFPPTEMENDKWSLQAVVIRGCSFVAICNSKIMSGVNKTATKLIGTEGMNAYGPIIFMLLDAEFSPIDIEVSVFKNLIA